MYKYKDEKGEHLHTFDNKPLIGTSTVTKVIAKPLTYWASGLAVKQFGCPDPKVLTKIKSNKATKEEKATFIDCASAKLAEIKTMDLEAYMNLIDVAYRAHACTLKEAASDGTDLHAELERYVKNTMENRMAVYDEKIMPFVKWSKENVKKFLWSEANCYSLVHWVGGITDAGAELNNGKVMVIDFKSSGDAYLDQFFQAWGYAIQIEENGLVDKNGNLIMKLEKPIDGAIVVPFGAKVVEPKFYLSSEGGKKGFLSALEIHKLKTLYES